MSVATVDEAIELYNSGYYQETITELERLISQGSLSFDEQLRAWDRLGSSYWAMGEMDSAENAYAELLRLDVYYDLGTRANPRLQIFLDNTRTSIMSIATIRSEPAGAFVTLEGQLMGVTPIVLEGLLVGDQYEVNVYQIGFETEYYLLTAQSGSDHILEFDLNLLPDIGSVAVADAGSSQVFNPNQTTNPRPDELISSPFETSVETVTETVQRPDELISSPFETIIETTQRPDELISSPFENLVETAQSTSEITITPPVETQVITASEERVYGQTSQSNHTAPQNTADLIAMLSGGSGIDVAAVNSSGSLTNGGNSSIGLAGSSGGRSGIVSSGVAAQAEALGREVMVFSDISSLGTPTATGTENYSSRTAEEIAELVAEKQGMVMYVYNKHLRTDPLLMGRVDVAMIIHPSGRVSDVEIVGSNMYNRAFELELLSSIEQWRFGSVNSSEGPLPIQLPLSFNP